MKIFYYFSHKRNEKEKILIQSIYGDEISYIDNLHEQTLELLNKGDWLICSSINELVNTDIDELKTDEIIKMYTDLLRKGVEISFDKSTQCNSLFIKTLITSKDDFEIVLRKCIANYFSQETIKQMYAKKHVITAKVNGNKVGAKKGKKIVTKKSIEAKQKITQLSKEFNGSLNDKEIIEKLGLGRNTYYKYKKELLTREEDK